ncbi:hypothetical protein ElyMa_000240600 [Elysia marginata]|uniref:Uncharacterized protein n=1 Tax=Elysia marginata TaxID=1093978 RepID=A0AAV4F3B0_9GAST|nr:hypothetical protein ElyMa_000240600 [Elysia marginata]
MEEQAILRYRAQNGGTFGQARAAVIVEVAKEVRPKLYAQAVRGGPIRKSVYGDGGDDDDDGGDDDGGDDGGDGGDGGDNDGGDGDGDDGDGDDGEEDEDDNEDDDDDGDGDDGDDDGGDGDGEEDEDDNEEEDDDDDDDDDTDISRTYKLSRFIKVIIVNHYRDVSDGGNDGDDDNK